jgi:hypothetical protein
MPMSAQELERIVRELKDREEIRDCLARYCRGVDRFDRELVLSAYHPDALDEHGKFVGHREDFAEWAIGQHADAHLSHQHCILNHSCELSEDTAHTETYFLFVAMNRTGKPVTMGGGRYVDRFEKRNGKWAIADRVCLRDWAMLEERPDMGDLSSFTSTRSLLPEKVRAFMNGGMAPSRDRGDPSYLRPFKVDRSRLDAYRALKRGDN